MARPVLIIDIGRESVSAAVFSPPGEKPLAFSSVPAARAGQGKAIAEAVASVRDKAPSGFEKAYASIHPSSMALRVLAVPFDDRKKINEVLPFELSGLIAVETSQAVIDNIPLGGGKALAVAVEKRVLKETLDALKGAGIDPVWTGSAYFALPGLLDELYGRQGTKAFIGTDFIAVSSEGSPVFFNSYANATGLKLSLAYLNAEGIRIEKACTAGADPDEFRALIPEAEITDIEAPGGLAPEIPALWLQVRKGLLDKNMDFRKGEFIYTKDRLALKKKLKVTAALAAALLALLSSDLYIRYMGLSREYSVYKESLSSAYRELFPDEKAPADELYGLAVKLKAVQRESDAVKGPFSALDIMKRLVDAASAPGVEIRLNEVIAADSKVKAVGEAASFEAADRFREAVSKDGSFTNAVLSDVKTLSGSKVAFSLSAAVK